MISVIVPVYNEEAVLEENLSRFQELNGPDIELIFSDGGSCDKTVSLARDAGKVVSSPRGRAKQMNEGARGACGDIFLFLHADTYISPATLTKIKETIESGFVGGCLTQRLLSDHPVYRSLEKFGNARARHKNIFYGDQGIFVKKDVFMDVGGFPNVVVMEDVLFSRYLRGQGALTVLDDLIYVSTRRWKNDGFIKTNLIYAFMNFLFFLKVPLWAIKQLYKDIR